MSGRIGTVYNANFFLLGFSTLPVTYKNHEFRLGFQRQNGDRTESTECAKSKYIESVNLTVAFGMRLNWTDRNPVEERSPFCLFNGVTLK